MLHDSGKITFTGIANADFGIQLHFSDSLIFFKKLLQIHHKELETMPNWNWVLSIILHGSEVKRTGLIAPFSKFIMLIYIEQQNTFIDFVVVWLPNKRTGNCGGRMSFNWPCHLTLYSVKDSLHHQLHCLCSLQILTLGQLLECCSIFPSSCFPVSKEYEEREVLTMFLGTHRFMTL